MEVAKLCCVNFTKLSLVTPNGIRTRTAKIVARWLARRHDLTCVGHKLHQPLETEDKRLITEGPKAGLNLNEKNNAKLTLPQWPSDWWAENRMKKRKTLSQDKLQNKVVNQSLFYWMDTYKYKYISYHIIPFDIISYHIILYHMISYHIISYHIISYHIISYQIIPFDIISYHIISYHMISYHIISYHIISYHIISYHIISYIIKYYIN